MKMRRTLYRFRPAPLIAPAPQEGLDGGVPELTRDRGDHGSGSCRSDRTRTTFRAGLVEGQQGTSRFLVKCPGIATVGWSTVGPGVRRLIGEEFE
jgi:hypothetical protein